ncbi:hypothetical protein BD626DRAFT_573627 [Schizophyllum amplum]|uniref:Uncharacterized protein n=1 Tax=Schizophyllum amplum TaxID=97359 RepID=A0A550C0U2_9AGAR|nr:hypothetical protein BD626DRAFT_573627 [Auriculariopsis ampla]
MTAESQELRKLVTHLTYDPVKDQERTQATSRIQTLVQRGDTIFPTLLIDPFALPTQSWHCTSPDVLIAQLELQTITQTLELDKDGTSGQTEPILAHVRHRWFAIVAWVELLHPGNDHFPAAYPHIKHI